MCTSCMHVLATLEGIALTADRNYQMVAQVRP
jgi:hypothetical protein